jgi:hypothetical protein
MQTAATTAVPLRSMPAITLPDVAYTPQLGWSSTRGACACSRKTPLA